MGKNLIETIDSDNNNEKLLERLEAYNRFLSAMNKKNVTPYNVSKNTGIATSTLSDWKNGKSMPKPDKIKKIANYLDVTMEYLLTGEEKEIPDPLLTDDFINLIDLYNSSNKDGQERIMEYAKMIAKEYKK